MLEQEKRWDLIQQGRAQDYHGVAVHPRHLSWFEKAVLKKHHQYKAGTDTQVDRPAPEQTLCPEGAHAAASNTQVSQLSPRSRYVQQIRQIVLDIGTESDFRGCMGSLSQLVL